MDVAGAVLGRLEDDRVDEADERGVRDAVVDLEVVLLVLDDLELVEVDLRYARSSASLGAREALDLGEDVVARRDGELDGVAASRAAARRSPRCRPGSAIATCSVLPSSSYGSALVRSSTAIGICSTASGETCSPRMSTYGRW